ncbi:hypothetical protein [Arcicella rigui]|uniref:Outer membrane protein beta-barrel domain-containing protein n=1 Tax=Arcicella rigui TaxID=797020 RepID=A0ABU5Q919_9BACT|nr:hypothetical protein [Arcicella rigui]MEA5139238.1 hypothetical protein [Arcicella rigui]
MKLSRIILLFLSFCPFLCTAQEESDWETQISIKTQFPIQHALGIEFISPIGLSSYFGLGQLSRNYTVLATNALPAKDENQAERQRFIKDKMKNGSVFEVGMNYYFGKKRKLYSGVNIQFQHFTLPATPKELFEKYNFGDQLALQNDLDDLLDRPIVQNFFENTLLTPNVNPIQLGFLLGFSIKIGKSEKLFLNPELNYQINLYTKTKVSASNPIGNILVNNIINPTIKQGSEESFGTFKLPSISLKFVYRFSN